MTSCKSARASRRCSFHGSIEHALHSYLAPELLEKDNQYECQQCLCKRDATKGFKFVKLPKILCLQLNRFTLDLQTFMRVKLNDRVSFPLTLNLNNYILKESEEKMDAAVYQRLLEDNPLLKVNVGDLRGNPFAEHHQAMAAAAAAEGEPGENETSRNFKQFMENELGELEEQEPKNVVG